MPAYPRKDVPIWDRLQQRPTYQTASTPVIDLTSPSSLRGGYGDNISYAGPPEYGFRVDEPSAHAGACREAPFANVYRPRRSDDDVTLNRVQARPAVHRHQSYNLGSTRDSVDMIKPEDYPIPSREQPHPAQHPSYPYYEEVGRRDVNVRPPPGITLQTRAVQHQPVFGQPAYPQMRSQTAAMQVVPRPVHGAPAAVQPMPPRDREASVGQSATSFGAPSPQRYFVGSSHLPYYVPDR